MAADDADLLRCDGSSLQVGDRIVCDENFGTVKYIGLVPPTKEWVLLRNRVRGLWLGVEWDDPSRGRHDGTHDGVRFFETRYPNSGSFVRPKKANLGIDCLQAIKDRYGEQKSGVAGVNTDELFVLDADNKQTIVEMVGAEKINQKQSQLHLLREVSLREMNVYGISSTLDLTSVTPNIQELDISKNLLTTWDMVARICGQLPKLQCLNISENLLSPPKDPVTLAKSFTTIKCLYLIRMGLTWEQVLQSAAMFPYLEQLFACDNGIQTLTEPHGHLSKLTLLSLQKNCINSWEEILKLGKLNELQTLILSENSIESIYFTDVPHNKKSSLFPQLRQLYMTGNKISQWSSFDELNKLQSLEELQLGSLRNLGDAETVRQIIVAKIGNLSRWNRTLIEEQERKGAETDYLKKFGPEWIKAGGSQDLARDNPNPQFLALHPRYQELVNKWGAPEDSEMKQQSKSLKDSLITVKINSPQDPEKKLLEKNLPTVKICSPQDPEKKVLEKNLPITMSVQKLKTLVQRIFKLDTNFTLSYISQKMKGPEIEFDNDLRQLSFYSVESGDTIQVKW